MMKKLTVALVLGYLSLPGASACSCAPITLQRSARNADSVYLATLQEAKAVPGDSRNLPSIEGKFLVNKTLKGNPPAAFIILRTPQEDGACGVQMMVAAKYVIFKRKDSDGIIACDGSGVLGYFGPVSQWDEDEVTAKFRASTRNGAAGKPGR